MAQLPRNRISNELGLGNAGADRFRRSVGGPALERSDVTQLLAVLPVTDATGDNRIKEPLPAEFGSVDPASGSPLRCQRDSAELTVMPISKQVPVQE